MRPSHLFPAMLLVIAGLTPTSAADLHKIDRTLKDEPKYNTRTPLYCLLVFGPEAKSHVWLVRDDDIMHVYDSSDGKSAKTWRQVKGNSSTFHLGDVREEGGKLHHKSLRFQTYTRRPRLSINIEGLGLQMAGLDRDGKLEFASSAKEAPIVHFNGPITMDIYREQEPLRTGTIEDLGVVVGTRGSGPGTFAILQCSAYPKNSWPKAVLEFPPKKAGDKPIVVSTSLAEE